MEPAEKRRHAFELEGDRLAEALPLPPRAAAPALPRWLTAGLLTLATLLVLASAAASFLVARQLHRLEHAATAQLAALGDRVERLRAQNEELKSEVAGLRTVLASATSEDVLFLKIVLLKPDVDPNLARVIARHVRHYSALYGKDPNLVLALIAVESAFNPKAVSPVGALGLMQVMPHWKGVLGIKEDLTDPETSVRYGLQILGFYEQMYKDMEMVLTAYNRGPGPVDMALMRGRTPDNGYAPKVLATFERLRKLTIKTTGT